MFFCHKHYISFPFCTEGAGEKNPNRISNSEPILDLKIRIFWFRTDASRFEGSTELLHSPSRVQETCPAFRIPAISQGNILVQGLSFPDNPAATSAKNSLATYGLAKIWLKPARLMSEARTSPFQDFMPSLLSVLQIRKTELSVSSQAYANLCSCIVGFF